MSKNSVNFDDKNINKRNFYKNKKPLKIYNTDVNGILVFKKEPYRTKTSIKYFIGYDDNGIIRQLCIKLPHMIVYIKCFDSNKTMSFKVSHRNF